MTSQKSAHVLRLSAHVLSDLHLVAFLVVEDVAAAFDHVFAMHLAQLESLEPQRVVTQLHRHRPELGDTCKMGVSE